LDAAVRDSMTRLATAALPFVDEAAGELERRRDACEQRLRDLFAACEAAIGEHSALGAEGLWVGQLRLAGHVTAYRPGARVAALRRTAEEIRRLSLGLDEDLHRQGEIAEAREREAEVDARMPLPPGTVVWQPGQPDKVVTEDGVEEIER
jgi:hypothetical protein